VLSSSFDVNVMTPRPTRTAWTAPNAPRTITNKPTNPDTAVLGLLTHVGTYLDHDVRTALSVGLIGGFTTLSTLTTQTVLEADGGRLGVAAVYFIVSTLGGLACSALGYVIGDAVIG
jgi:hypothetical protein